MKKYFYDKQENTVRNTEETYKFFLEYWKNEYDSFNDYMNTVFPCFVWIDNFSEV